MDNIIRGIVRVRKMNTFSSFWLYLSLGNSYFTLLWEYKLIGMV